MINCDTLVLVVCRVGQSQNSWVRRKVVPSQSSLSLSHDSFSNDPLIASSGPLLFQLDNLTKNKVIIKQSLEIGKRHVFEIELKMIYLDLDFLKNLFSYQEILSIL